MNESMVRMILIVVGLFVVVWIWINGRKNRRKRKIITGVEASKCRGVEAEKKEEESAEVPECRDVEVEEKEETGIEVPECRGGEVEKKEEVGVEVEEEVENVVKPEKIVFMRVRALEGNSFGGYDLLQSLLAQQLHFGDKQFFHYYDADDVEREHPQFSLAADTQTGTFDLSKIGGFSCGGLVLFTNINGQANPLKTFDTMLNLAQSLAEDLKGEIRTDKNQPWTEDVTKKIRGQLES
jgi:cell division protein ZipA